MFPKLINTIHNSSAIKSMVDKHAPDDLKRRIYDIVGWTCGNCGGGNPLSSAYCQWCGN